MMYAVYGPSADATSANAVMQRAKRNLATGSRDLDGKSLREGVHSNPSLQLLTEAIEYGVDRASRH
jgi:hypothetical protein